jgi:hypothetical protein
MEAAPVFSREALEDDAIKREDDPLPLECCIFHTNNPQRGPAPLAVSRLRPAFRAIRIHAAASLLC